MGFAIGWLVSRQIVYVLRVSSVNLLFKNGAGSLASPACGISLQIVGGILITILRGLP
jgi:hypothetical protein